MPNYFGAAITAAQCCPTREFFYKHTLYRTLSCWASSYLDGRCPHGQVTLLSMFVVQFPLSGTEISVSADLKAACDSLRSEQPLVQ